MQSGPVGLDPRGGGWNEFLREHLPHLRLRFPGFLRVKRKLWKKLARRLNELGLSDPRAYADWLEAHPSEWEVLDRLCRMTLSRFYRDAAVFEVLETVVLPSLIARARERGARRIACWCAGCACGEEAYSLRILWALGPGAGQPGIALRILATDADEEVLGRAAAGCYPWSSLREVPPLWREMAFVRAGEQAWVRDEFREGVRFLAHDIRTEPPDGLFDLVLCRNSVFTYFETDLQREVLERIARIMLPGGGLVLGIKETLPATPMFEPWDERLKIHRRTTPKQ
jgi:chemotaxis protein methyltransferase CheR